ncbi:MAG: hypothetical protein JNK06_18635 [Candidatus Accumulibacter phosphatis]|uniref:hypothetical protein n=1 Tax=Candidatus Accumulibacter phosphatis TaxID=327160 RepID=UPI001A3C8FE2|nr:hypothetical protein [Candidatus Accumulibacter phosphatis]
MSRAQALCKRLVPMLRDFIVFEDDGGRMTKKMAGCHQFHAVLVAVGETLRAAQLQAILIRADPFAHALAARARAALTDVTRR